MLGNSSSHEASFWYVLDCFGLPLNFLLELLTRQNKIRHGFVHISLQIESMGNPLDFSGCMMVVVPLSLRTILNKKSSPQSPVCIPTPPKKKLGKQAISATPQELIARAKELLVDYKHLGLRASVFWGKRATGVKEGEARREEKRGGCQHIVDGRNPANHLGYINHVHNGIFTISTGAGCLPSTVS